MNSSAKRYTTILGTTSDSIDGMKPAPSVPHDSSYLQVGGDIDHSSIEAYLATAPASGRLDSGSMGRGTPAHPPGSGQWKDETTLLNSTGAVTKQGSKGEDRANWSANEELSFDDIGDTLTCNSSTAMICQRLHDSGSSLGSDHRVFSRIVMPILRSVHKASAARKTTNKVALAGYAKVAAGKEPTKNQSREMARADSYATKRIMPKLRESYGATHDRALTR